MPEAAVRETNPEIAMKASLEYAESLTGEKTKVAWVQNIGQLIQLKDGITYSAIDKDEEYMAKGKNKAEAIDVEILFLHTNHKKIKEMAESDKVFYWFIKYPEATAAVAGKPLTFSLKANIDFAANSVEDGELLKDTIRMFKKSKVVETDGYPTNEDESKY